MNVKTTYSAVFTIMFAAACGKTFTEVEYLQRADAEKSKGNVAAAVIRRVPFRTLIYRHYV